MCFCCDGNLSLFHIWVSSNSTWLRCSVRWNLVLCSFYVRFVVRMCLIDVCLHHLVLLIDNCTSWNYHAFVTFLSRLSNTLESRVLTGDVRLQCIHRLWSSHDILSVSHLILSSVKLWTFRNVSLLLFWVDLEAVRVLEALCLTWRSTRHRGTCPISWNFSRRLIIKNKLLIALSFMWLAIALTDYLTIHRCMLLKLNGLNVSSWLRMTLRTNTVAAT